MSLSKNLRNLMNKIGIGENELARKTGVRQPIIHRILSGENKNPQIDTIKPLSNFFSVRISQLIGEEPIHSSELGVIQREAHFFVKVRLLQWEKLIEDFEADIDVHKNFVHVDMSLSQQAFALKLIDDSMEPRFPNKTLVIFDPNVEPKNRSFIILLPSDQKMGIFRQIHIDDNHRFAISLNPSHKDFRQIDLAKGDRILGVMVRAVYDDC
jgi:transcriptional regulator with XRE-family HTH domain